MDKSKLIKLLEEKKWKNIKQETEEYGYKFDIVGQRMWMFTKWFILLTFTKKLTKENIQKFQNDFNDISKKSKSYFWGKCFLYCVIADSIDPSVINDIERDSFGLGGVLRLQGGGGNIFLVDLSKKKIHGKVPPLPYDVHKFSKDLTEVLQNTI